MQSSFGPYKFCPFIIVALVGACLSTSVQAQSDSKKEEFSEVERLFLAKIKPLFARKCGACHGETAKSLKGDFDMRTKEAMLLGGESGESAIDLENVEQSPLLLAIEWKDGLEMPPKENDRLSEEEIGWVRQWLRKGAPWPRAQPSNGNDNWTDDPSQVVVVATSGGQSTTWDQRLYKSEDLWAYMPISKIEVPTSETTQQNPIDAFVSRKLHSLGLVPAELAEDKILRRRVAYSLTGLPAGNTGAVRYEDYVDQLLSSPHYGERMAQHWLDVVRYADSNGFSRDDFRAEAHQYRTYVIRSFNEDKPFDQFVREQIAGDQLGIADQSALAYLWMGPWEHTAMSVAAVTRQQWLDDVTNTISVTFLGQQLRCAKCHDHKFDPIPTQDYYRFQAIFAGTKHHVKEGQFKIQSQQPQEIAILQGGALESPGDVVPAGALSLLGTTAGHSFELADAKQSRATLAKWIASNKNPLTARVFVNRVWQMHFGKGLVATPNDFGKMGADPTHPELLDWLAGWFMEQGWSVKTLHRLILTSETYRRSSTHPDPTSVAKLDPTNQLLSYFPARRLTAEEIRDSMLVVSGELNREIGGPSTYPEINWEVAFQPRLLMGKIAPPYQPSSKRAERNRRSIYAVRIRNLGHPFMEVMNRPNSELSCDRRDETTVVPQAFTLFHSEFVHERSLALANRIAKQHESLDQQVNAAFMSVYQRPPSQAEADVAKTHVKEMLKLHESHKVEEQPLPTSIEVQDVAERTGASTTKKFELQNLKNYEDDLKPWQVDEQTRALADLCLVLLNSSEFLFVY